MVMMNDFKDNRYCDIGVLYMNCYYYIEYKFINNSERLLWILMQQSGSECLLINIIIKQHYIIL